MKISEFLGEGGFKPFYTNMESNEPYDDCRANFDWLRRDVQFPSTTYYKEKACM